MSTFDSGPLFLVLVHMYRIFHGNMTDTVPALFLLAEGPHSQVYAHSLTADNATMSIVDLGDMGGMLHSTSFVEGDSLVTQLRDQETNNHTITSTRTRTEGESIRYTLFRSLGTSLLLQDRI